jgi:uncharacterized protein YjlB
VERVEVQTLRLPRGDQVPNNGRYPAVIARDALGGAQDDAEVKALLQANGWGGAWTWQVFTYHHFHPDAFEVLAVAHGSATLMLGGPQGEEVKVEAGDVVVLPPGFGHKQVEAHDSFAICGAYPPGQEDYSIIRAEDGYDDKVLAEIESVPTPQTDPVWGGSGPLLAALTGSR